jgi:hypothetical protein
MWIASSSNAVHQLREVKPAPVFHVMELGCIGATPMNPCCVSDARPLSYIVETYLPRFNHKAGRYCAQERYHRGGRFPGGAKGERTLNGIALVSPPAINRV